MVLGNLIATAAPYLFPGGRALKLVKNGINITKSTNPVTLGMNISLTILDCCATPPLRLAAHCVAAGSLVGASVVAPNPVTIGSAIHLATGIYDNCY